VNNIEKLYSELINSGLIKNTKLEDFMNGLENEDYLKAVYDNSVDQGLFTQDFDKFKSTYSMDANRKKVLSGFDDLDITDDEAKDEISFFEGAKRLVKNKIPYIEKIGRNFFEASASFIEFMADKDTAAFYASGFDFDFDKDKLNDPRKSGLLDTETGELLTFDNDAYERDGHDAEENKRWYALVKKMRSVPRYRQTERGREDYPNPIRNVKINKDGSTEDVEDLFAKYQAENHKKSLEAAAKMEKITDSDTFVEAVKKGRVGDILLKSTDFLAETGIQFGAAALTFSTSMMAQMYGAAYSDFNDEKAKAIYGEDDPEAFEKLVANGQDQIGVPAAWGGLGYLLERVGFKGVTRAIAKKSFKGKNKAALLVAGNKEGVTEFAQGITERANINQGKGMSAKESADDIANYVTTEEAWDNYFAGLIGGGGMGAIQQQRIKSLRANQNSNIFINQKVDNLSILADRLAAAKTEKERKKIKEDIQIEHNDLQEFLLQNKKLDEYLSEKQSEGLNSILENVNSTKKQIKDIQSLFKKGLVSKADADAQIAALTQKIERYDDGINKIRNDANMSMLQQDLDASGQLVKAMKGLEQEVYKTEQEFLDALKAKILEQGGTEQDFTNATQDKAGNKYAIDGLKVGNTLLVNAEVAAKRNATATGTHEVLHGLLKSTLQENDGSGNLSKDGEKIVNDFLNTLSKSERKALDKRLDAGNYKKNKDGTEKEFKEYGEEYINFYAQLSKEDKLDVSKVGKFLGNLFRNKTEFKQISFETGADTRAFLDAMVADSKKGIYRKEISDFAAQQDLTGDTTVKASMTANQKAEVKQQVDNLGSQSELGDNFREEGVGKFLYDAEVDNVISKIKNEGYLDGLIASKFKGDRVPRDFVSQVVTELTSHIKNFNPETNDSLFGWINSQLANKAGNVYNREYKATQTDAGRARDIGETTQEGEVKVQVAADTDTALEALETEDLSIGAQKKSKAEVAEKTSRFRKLLGFEKGDKMFNDVLDATKKSIVLAYRKAQSIENPAKRAAEVKNLIHNEYFTKGLTSDVFKPLKNFLGAKTYIKNLKEHREAIFSSISVADLVQMERKVPENQRVFTTFEKQLTSKQEVEDAVRKDLLPLDALNKIDKGQAVNLYKRRMPTEQELVDYADQPAINPETGARSGLKGTRKDGIAKAIAVTLVKDATMEARQSEEVVERISESDNYQADIQELSAAIGRDANIMFSRTQVVDGLADNVIDVLQDLASGKRQIQDIVEVEYSNGKASKYNLKIPFKKRYEKGDREHSAQDKAVAARVIYNTHFSQDYGDTVDAKLKKRLVEDIVKSSKKGKKINLGLALENLIRKNLDPFLNKTGLESLRGKGDIYLGLKNLTIGVESKLDKARGVSQTINIVKDKLNFTNKNNTKNEAGKLFDDVIGDLMLQQYNQIKQDLENAGIPLVSNELTNAQVKFLKANKSKYGVSTEVNLEYLTWHYAHGKYAKMPQGFIQVGQKLYRMATGNKSVDSLSGKVAAQLDIPNIKLSENKKLELVARLPVQGKKIVFRMSPRIDGAKFNDSTFNLLDKAQAESFTETVSNVLKSEVKIQNSKTLSKAAVKARPVLQYSKTSKGMSTFDFDETLIIDGENFVTATKDQDVVKIPSDKWPIDGPRLAEQGYEFDFSDFVNVRGGKEGPLLQKMKNQIAKYGSDNVFVLTARMQEAAQPIHQWLKSKGINIPLENITGLGKSEGEAKALWMLEKYAEGYNDMYFVDDALPNVEAVQNVFNQLDIKGKSVQAKIKFSRSLDKDFNSIIETLTGIEANKRFSDVKARKRGASKGKFRYFIPPSHEDFVGLLYNFMGKGAEGNRHRDFFERALVRPLNRAYRELDTAKQSIANDFKALNKKFPDIKKKLKKNTADGDFTFEDAIRVYIWDKNEHDIPGLSKKDKEMLLEYVKLDPVLEQYANTIEQISRVEGYIPPVESWEAGDIKTDLMDATGKVGRDQYFNEFNENAAEIFSKDNLNKIEAGYGRSVREALEDMLYSIQTGQRRPQGQNKIVNAFVNFINASVGTVMFFNMRSALLQQMSIVNYMNFADNNLFAMAKAFANQKQYWTDWAMIFNSDMLKQRRGGIQTDVNGAELVQTVTKSKFPMRSVIKKLLAIGFTPTQIGDSIAISTGGSTFYRNRVNRYLKDGLTKEQAEKAAFNDFNEITQATQQSAREDMISQQQRSAAGKFILAFQNVTSQFNRLGKKAFSDLKNRRITKPNETQLQSDISNVARLTYYIGIQNMLFYSLQTALFMAMFDDDDELTDKEKKSRDKKYEYAVNGAIDSVLRGTGVYGAIAATVKNMAIKWKQQRDKKYNKDESAVLMAALDVSPPLGIKARRIVSAEKTLNYNEDAIKHMELSDIDNPIWPAVTSYAELVNIPLNKTYNKVQNVRQSLNDEHEDLERVMMFFGWSQYNLGLENTKMEGVKQNIKDKERKDKNSKFEAQQKEELRRARKGQIDINKITCSAAVGSGARCKRKPVSKGKCTIHQEVELSKDRKQKQCRKIKSDGSRCKMMTQSKNQLCYYHD